MYSAVAFLRPGAIGLRIVSLLAAMLSLPAGAATPPPAPPSLYGHHLSWHGIGPLRVGMTRRQLHALGFVVDLRHARPDDAVRALSYGGCLSLPLRSHPQVTVMFQDTVLVRVTNHDPRIATVAGIAPGATAPAIRTAYAGKLQEWGHKYLENGRTMTLRSRNGAHAMVFNSEAGVLTQVHAGQAEAAQLVEDCL